MWLPEVGRSTSDRGLKRAFAPELGDDGFSLIECLVAVVLIVIILLPTTFFIIEGNRASYATHLRAEATNLATQSLEGLQLEAAQGRLPGGFQSQSQSVDETAGRKTVFKISTTWNTVTQGTNTSICASGAGPAQQIWVATTSVSWAGQSGNSPVVQTSEISPAQAGALQFSSGELAVRLSLDGTAANLYLASQVTATVNGVWTGSGAAPAVPGGQQITEQDSSGGAAPGGCIVFSDLDVDTGWTYDVSFAGNPNIVSQQEYSDNNPNGPLQVNNVVLQAGVPDIVTVEVNTASTVNVNYVTPGTNACTGGTGSIPPAQTTPSVIPVSVSNTTLSYPSYPPSSGPTWTVAGTKVITSLALFPTTLQTTMWAGDMPYGAPIWSGWGSKAQAACTVATVAPSTVDLPLYPLKLTGGPWTGLTATEAGEAGGYSFLLQGTGSGSLTSLPLGRYTLSDLNGSISSAGSPGTPVLVWISPAGECVGPVATTPPSPCTATTLAVTS
jgi:prepilin-type N-terminal cleavage/methylation domain-containing protein